MEANRPGRSVQRGSVPFPRPRNYRVLDIRWSSEGRGYGVFAYDRLPSRYQVIYEQPLLSCVHRTQPPNESTVVEEWKGLTPLYRAFLGEKFRRLRHISKGDTVSKRDEKRLRQFIRDYAFADPAHGRAHVYGLASHINHACTSCANAEVWVEPTEPNYITVRLMKPIAKDQEVYINYNRRNLKFNCALCGTRGFRGLLKKAWGKIRAKAKHNDTAATNDEEDDKTPENSSS